MRTCSPSDQVKMCLKRQERDFGFEVGFGAGWSFWNCTWEEFGGGSVLDEDIKYY